MHLVGFIIRIYHDALSLERQTLSLLLGLHKQDYIKKLTWNMPLLWNICEPELCSCKMQKSEDTHIWD